MYDKLFLPLFHMESSYFLNIITTMPKKSGCLFRFLLLILVITGICASLVPQFKDPPGLYEFVKGAI